MCERCLKKLGDTLGIVTETVEQRVDAHGAKELTATMKLKTSPGGAAQCEGYTVLVNNCVEDVGSGMGIAVIIAVNPRFVELAESKTEHMDPAVALMMAATALKEAMPPLAAAMRQASVGAPEMPRGDEHSPKN